MVSSDWAPDFVVGVDFGMTCTGTIWGKGSPTHWKSGIAYSYAPEWAPPKPLQHWPSMITTELANKVPSQLRYRSDSVSVKSWGFQCESDDGDGDQGDIKEYFKLNLDPAFKDHRLDGPTRKEAMQWFRDYIRCVYDYTVSYFARSFPRFGSRKVEFVFSIPTTWKDPRMVAELRELIQFDSPNHRATIGLTEAEAAAVYASGQYYQPNDVVLVCDAGGGTMDVNILKLVSTQHEPTKFTPLGVVEGKPIGSVQIDMGAHQLLCNKLEHIRNVLPKQPRDIAFDMISGRFERFKCSFGEKAMESPDLVLDVPGLSHGFDCPAASVSDGQMHMTRDEIKKLFDMKVEEMYELLDDQIDRLKNEHPTEQISFLVLSGGFGSSPYVRRCLKNRYSDPATIPNIVEILTVDEPQLAVVQGQVINRIQEIKHGATALQSLYTRNSYGVICDQLYDPEKHVGQPVRYDERNKKRYAVQQIEWLIFQGDSVSRSGVSKAFQRKINPKEVSQPWVAQIVMSTLPKRQLPRSMSQPGAGLVCNLEVDMASVERKPKNHHWYNVNPAYLVANFDIKINVGVNDLQFELWNSNGTRISSQNRHPLKVQWQPVVEKMSDEPTSLHELAG
ncbi:hypothetical protein ARAM_004684 [Aspergillus rambellii]|uniref:Hsp70 family chaperone n=1 Tax=Aspergillus rambellii TaxID=308745 RepID=A0A0F8U7G8_9EURO|nr:hypothetical protein ARAM_004684 [Aspergillus rambellii]